MPRGPGGCKVGVSGAAGAVQAAATLAESWWDPRKGLRGSLRGSSSLLPRLPCA